MFAIRWFAKRWFGSRWFSPPANIEFPPIPGDSTISVGIVNGTQLGLIVSNTATVSTMLMPFGSVVMTASDPELAASVPVGVQLGVFAVGQNTSDIDDSGSASVGVSMTGSDLDVTAAGDNEAEVNA